MIDKIINESNEFKSIKNDISLTNIDILRAFSENWIFLVYQPQFDFRNGDLLGVETLSRIRHPVYGDLKPDKFLPLIKDMGLMLHLFNLVLDKATSALGIFATNIKLSINICQNILQEDICDFIIDVCRKNNFTYSNLILELTEEQAYNRTPNLLANLARLELNNIKLSIDDFGTGYASLDQLINFPFSELKIDRKFISGICHDYKRQQMTKLSLFLAQSLGINCVAEGVEDKETWEYLRELGVDICQGYYTGKPLPIYEFKELYNLFIETKKNKPLVYKNATILILVNKSLSISAFERLLSKELDDYTIITESYTDTETINNILRDYAISFIISEYILFEKFKNIKFDTDINNASLLLLTDKKFDDNLKIKSNVIPIIRSGTLQEDVRNIIHNIKQNQTLLNPIYESLSKQEQAVTKLLIAGFTNKYIARELNLNEKTISTYKKRVLNKLNVNSTVELYQVLGHSIVK
ncbi:EAL domain-containing protein [Photobacterium kishitanii]|uniref:EAL domain-containing protein n=1 Tax=Photobacterium kishitanii TaxID=318456 RepID=UPI0033906076